MSKSRGGFLSFLSMLVGLILGGLAALLLTTDETGDTKAPVKTKIKTLKTKLREASESDRVKKIFGQTSQEATTRYRQAKDLLISKLGQLKEAVESIDKDKYKSVVETVMADLKKDGAMTATQLKKLAGYLQADYKKLAAKPKAAKAKKH